LASLIDNLISVLSDENDLYEKLIPIAEKKTQVIVAGDLNTLQEITAQEQSIVDKISALEKQREKVIADMGTVLGKNPKELNFRTLVEILKGQKDEAERLRALHDRLKKTTDRMVMLNDRNKALIQQSLEMIEYNLNYIQSAWMGPEVGQYGKSAEENNVQSLGTGMFDAKQ